jgi:hypothetical protein
MATLNMQVSAAGGLLDHVQRHVREAGREEDGSFRLQGIESLAL